jgi:long-chain acyl-CoA synthetase
MKPFPSLFDAFLHQVESQPDKVALVVESEPGCVDELSWRQLGRLVSGLANEWMDAFDADPQLPRRIGYTSDNSLADVVIVLATMSVGAIEVPLDARLFDEEIERRWSHVGGLWIEDRLDVLRFAGDFELKVRATRDADASALILWTSGTTGESKGVTLSDRNLVGNAMAKLAAVPQSKDDVRLTVLPLCHGYARTCDLGTWLLSGSTLAITLGFAGLQRMAPVVRPTLINSVPSIATKLLEQDLQVLGMDRLRLLGCGGAAIGEPAFHSWKDRGVTVIQGYGLTETSPVICSATPENAKAGLVGRLVDGWESEVREGELFVRGPHTMLGYWNDEQATATKIDQDGWLATGDRVEQDPATGQFRILGREDDVIVLSNGCKLSPEVIEREIGQLAGVNHAMLVSRERLVLWLDVQPNFDETVVRQRLAQFPGCKSCDIQRFATPLQEESGELTAKGTIRRSRILANRFQ